MATAGDLARDLLVRATEDLAAAKALLDAPGVSEAMVGFHCQQAAEKALKAVLASRSVDFPHTHDLAALVELLETAGEALPADLGEVDLLTPFGVRLRYATVEDALLVSGATGLGWAELAVTWAREILDRPGKPS